MKTPLSDELEELMPKDHECCISIYLPRHRGEGQIRQDRIQFKNLLGKARRGLLSKDWSPEAADELLKPVYDLMADNQFWSEDANGLAVFASPRISQSYALLLRPKALVVVAHHFYILPFLAQEQANHLFYVLTLSQNRVRLLRGSATGLVDLNLQGLPENLTQALGYEIAEKQSGVRSLPPSVGGGGRQGIFYGQGAGPDDSKDELVRYFRVIDTALHDPLKGEHAPLVLAAVGYILPLYREVNTYPHLVEKGIEGNPDKVSLNRLHARAREIIQPLLKQSECEALDRYRRLVGTGLATCDPEEILRGAFEGRVREFFVAPQTEKWGHFDPITGSVLIQPLDKPEGEDLLNLAAIYTLSNRGTVYFIDPKKMPAGETLAATYRY